MRRLVRFGRWSSAPLATVVGGNAVSLLHDGASCFAAMLSEIATAKEEVVLEMYWFASDETGRRFARALSERARAGLRVLVVYDAVGSLEADPRMFDEMRAAGCEVIEFHPISPFRQRFKLGTLGRRDHRKILVVDGRVAFTGSINLGNEWAPVSEGGDGFRDDMIRIEGDAAGELRRLVYETHSRLVGGEPTDPSQSSAREAPPPGASPVRVIATHGGQSRAIRRAYLDVIRRARRYVFIANSYFVPDREVRVALERAAERGVDVRILVPGKSDVIAVYFATRRLYALLARKGVKIYEWHRAVFHAKYAVIDDAWCTVGSYNLDYRSLRYNLEVNVVVEDARVGEQLRARFHTDLEDAALVDMHTFRFRPLSERLLEHFFYFFRKLL